MNQDLRSRAPNASRINSSMIGGIVGGIGAGLLALAIIIFVIVKYFTCYHIKPNSNDTMIGQSNDMCKANVGATIEESHDGGKILIILDHII